MTTMKNKFNSLAKLQPIMISKLIPFRLKLPLLDVCNCCCCSGHNMQKRLKWKYSYYINGNQLQLPHSPSNSEERERDTATELEKGWSWTLLWWCDWLAARWYIFNGLCLFVDMSLVELFTCIYYLCRVIYCELWQAAYGIAYRGERSTRCNSSMGVPHF